MRSCLGLRICVDVFRTDNGSSVRSVTISADHLEPIDIAGILIELEIIGPRGTAWFPHSKRLTHEDWDRAYREAIRTVLSDHRDLLVSCGLIEWWQLPTPNAVDYFREFFIPWKRDTFRTALRATSISSKRLSAIRDALHEVSELASIRLFGAWIADARTVRAENSGGRPTKITPVRSFETFTQIHEIAFSRPDLLFVGEDGRWYIFGPLLRDATRDRRKDAQGSKARVSMDVALEVATDEPDPASITEVRERIEVVRALREVAQSKGPAYEAAFEHLALSTSREALVTKFSVSVKQIRLAEDDLRTDLRRRYRAN